MKIRHTVTALLLAGFLAMPTWALEVTVIDTDNNPVDLAMVTARQFPDQPWDQSDHGYPKPESTFTLQVERTGFTRELLGTVMLNVMDFPDSVTLRVRKPGYKDANVGPFATDATVAITLITETDPLALAMAKPGNTWASQIDFGNEADNKRYQMQCGFCHQQGSVPLRVIQTPQQWDAAIGRMIKYGSRLPTRLQEKAPELLAKQHQAMMQDPASIPDPLPWQAQLTGAVIEAWPAGDIYSQMHDLVVHHGKTYVGDNTQDRLWILDYETHETYVKVTPRQEEDVLGGLIAARLVDFPKRLDYTALHSLAVSEKDGHIFMTPSNQRRLLEYNPETDEITSIDLNDGFYPHTIRIDQKDRVWFTLALSNQIGMYDRRDGSFQIVDLPARSFRESLTLFLIPTLFKFASWGLPISKLPIDDISTGVPLPYGIDVSPDGTIWFARLHANDVGRIDPETLEFELIDAPFMGPRRLRVDAAGNPWIGAFGEGAVYKLDPNTLEFTRYDMPTLPKGSDTPYAIGMDRARNIMWATGTASDTLNAFHIDSEQWEVFPLPRRMTFTREIEVAPDGSVFTANGAFPAWHVEDGKPEIIRVIPSWANTP